MELRDFFYSNKKISSLPNKSNFQRHLHKKRTVKKTILFFAILAATFSFSQKKMIAKSMYTFSQNIPNTIDSLAYTYNTWQGALGSFEPEMNYSDEKLDWLFGNPRLIFDTASSFSGTNHPLTFDEQENQTVFYDKISQTEHPNGDRTLYSYSTDGKTKNKVKQSLVNGIWRSKDSIVFNYTNLGDVFETTTYKDFIFTDTNFVLHKSKVDSIFYLSNSSKPTTFKTYNRVSETTLFNLNVRTEYNYNSAGNPTSSDRYLYFNPGVASWFSHDVYVFVNDQYTSFFRYAISGNTPSLNPQYEIHYSFNADNQMSSYQYIQSQDSIHVQLTYDTENFLTQSSAVVNNSNGNNEILWKNHYYFQSVAGLDEKIDLSLSIYPNPASDVLTILSEGKIESIELLNFSGQVLLRQKTNIIDINHLAQGQYIVRGSTSEGVFSKKIVKL